MYQNAKSLFFVCQAEILTCMHWIYLAFET